MRSSGIDSPEIGARAREIAAERLRSITACACKRHDGGGEVDTSACPIHRSPAADPCGLTDQTRQAIRERAALVDARLRKALGD